MLNHAVNHGLLLLQAGADVLRFLPPLNISSEEVDEGLQRLRAAVTAFVAAGFWELSFARMSNASK